MPGRDREPRRGRGPARAADLAGRCLRGRRLRRVLLAFPRGAGAHRPLPLAALSALAHPRDRLGVGRWGPEDDHPRPRGTAVGDRDDRVRAPRRGRSSSTSTQSACWARGIPSASGWNTPPPTVPCSSPTSVGTPRGGGPHGARPAEALPRLHAQRHRSDGLHAHGLRARRPLRPGRPRAAGRRHQRARRGRCHRLVHGGGGIGSRAAGRGHRPHRGR